MKKLLKSKDFLVPLITGAVVAAAVCAASKDHGIVHMLCDGFFVAGVVVLGFGGLQFSANKGMFDIFSFGVKKVLDVHWPGITQSTEEERREQYVDYTLRKRAARKSPKGTVVAGCVYMALAAVMLAIYVAI